MYESFKTVSEWEINCYSKDETDLYSIIFLTVNKPVKKTKTNAACETNVNTH